ncbi:MAG: MerC family mercury resistance protein [Methylobacter sp.]|uniref:MerC domain-containing protein n=1 Tax=Methylobacter sp. TaxID=2051955 RepID=UPI00258A9313|nr:MerC domain-containing protein [Methylobacter sp.]MCL7419697.1 MerC family mercury resistance protein [Methylobacter sp.]
MTQRTPYMKLLSALPAIGIAVLPKLTCAACWPIYSGLLGSLGLGFVNYTPYLLPLTVFFLALSLASLAYRARSRRGYRPFFLGLPAAAMVIVGKFVFASDIALYSGAALLVGASFWHSWPKSSGGSCPVCVPNGPLSISEHKRP